MLVAAVDLGSSDDGLWVPLVILAGSLLFVGAMAKLSLWLTARERLALLSLPPCCLACGYELKGIAEADDGCTVCPECGGAWRLPLFTADQAK